VRLICEFASRVEQSELAHVRDEVRNLGRVGENEEIVLVINELFTLAVRSGATSAVTRLFDGGGETSVSIATDAPVALAPKVDSLAESILQRLALQWGHRSTIAGTEWWATVE
jgi:hypothetical protein